MDNLTKQCIADVGPKAYQDIFVDGEDAKYLAVAIPVLAGLGIIGRYIIMYLVLLWQTGGSSPRKLGLSIIGNEGIIPSIY
jgi:hypothetical protein